MMKRIVKCLRSKTPRHPGNPRYPKHPRHSDFTEGGEIAKADRLRMTC